MFEIRVMIDDKKLSNFLWLLDGQIVGQPTILPVRGALSKGGKLISSNNGTNIASQVYGKLAQKTWVSDVEIADAISDCGGKASIKSYVIQQLKKAGCISTRCQQGKNAGLFKILKQRKGKK